MQKIMWKFILYILHLDENKSQLDHIQTDFVTPQVLGVSAHHKNGSNGHRLNGVLPRMNITPNPLAQDGSDKVGRNFYIFIQFTDWYSILLSTSTYTFKHFSLLEAF